MGHEQLLQQAIEISARSIAAGGGPFGAVIALDGNVLATGHNRVTLDRDPTAHAEVVAIRAACQKLGTHDLSGSVLYSSCEPCPMCLSAAYWAHVDHVYFGATRDDAASVGFSDAHIYAELARPSHERALPQTQLRHSEALAALSEWHHVAPDRHY